MFLLHRIKGKVFDNNKIFRVNRTATVTIGYAWIMTSYYVVTYKTVSSHHTNEKSYYKIIVKKIYKTF